MSYPPTPPKTKDDDRHHGLRVVVQDRQRILEGIGGSVSPVEYWVMAGPVAGEGVREGYVVCLVERRTADDVLDAPHLPPKGYCGMVGPIIHRSRFWLAYTLDPRSESEYEYKQTVRLLVPLPYSSLGFFEMVQHYWLCLIHPRVDLTEYLAHRPAAGGCVIRPETPTLPLPVAHRAGSGTLRHAGSTVGTLIGSTSGPTPFPSRLSVDTISVRDLYYYGGGVAPLKDGMCLGRCWFRVGYMC